jgi:outer membrane pore protein E
MGVVASASVHAAEVYNKDGNKLDVYGKVKAMHYISDDATKDGDQTYVRFGFKGETQINDQLTGYGRWEAEFAGNKAESDSSQKTRLAFAGLKLKNFGSWTTVVTWAHCTTLKPGPICSLNSAATLLLRPITS